MIKTGVILVRGKHHSVYGKKLHLVAREAKHGKLVSEDVHKGIHLSEVPSAREHSSQRGDSSRVSLQHFEILQLELTNVQPDDTLWSFLRVSQHSQQAPPFQSTCSGPLERRLSPWRQGL